MITHYNIKNIIDVQNFQFVCLPWEFLLVCQCRVVIRILDVLIGNHVKYCNILISSSS